MSQQFNKPDIRKGTIEAMDQFASPPPGVSLTSPVEKWPWGNPPQDVDPDVVLEKATERLDDEVFRDEMMKLLFAGVSIEHIVESWVIDGFENGKFSLDAGLLAKGPLATYIAYIAEIEDVPYRMFQNDNPKGQERLDNETYFRLMQRNNPRMFNSIREEMNRTVREGIDKMPERRKELEGQITQSEKQEVGMPEGFMGMAPTTGEEEQS